MTDLMIYLLIAQALMGAFDTLYHHELTVALPRSPTAGKELAIHAIRSVLYGVLFAGLAWFEWGGYWAVLLVAIVLIEVALTLWDFVVEDRTRMLPPSERILHTLLAINGGAVFLLLAMAIPEWFARASELYPVDYGWRSWFLSAAALGVFISGLRDGLAAWATRRLDLELELNLGEHRRILISGGTGFIGSALVRELLAQGHEVTLLARNPVAAAIRFDAKLRAVGNCETLSDHEAFDVVVNLAGAPVVGQPWSERRKAVLEKSRYDSTRNLLAFVKRARLRPRVWIQASATGFYGTRAAAALDENTGAGEGFAADLCRRWEGITRELEALDIRRVVLRFGMVFGRSGGALPKMLLPFRLGLGTVIGNGRQHLSWIHLEDLLRLIAYAIRESSVDGAINAVAPECPTYGEFARLAGKLLHRPVWIRMPDSVLRKSLGEMASMFADGPVIKPARLGRFEFEYRFPRLRGALMDLA